MAISSVLAILSPDGDWPGLAAPFAQPASAHISLPALAPGRAILKTLSR